jgi:hypothetical protein
MHFACKNVETGMNFVKKKHGYKTSAMKETIIYKQFLS